MPTDTRLIINGLDRAGDVLAEMAKREGTFQVHLYAKADGGIEFAVTGFIGHTFVTSPSAPTLPGAYLKYIATRSEKQAEIDAEAKQRAEFEAWKARQAQAQAAA